MLDRYTEEEVRSKCRSAIESLEVWLRNLIDFELARHYGSEFYDFQDEKSNRLLKLSLVKFCKQKLSNEPTRYSRFIDTTYLDEIIDIICNPNLYNNHFHEALKLAFPLKKEQARCTLSKLIEPRNLLSHANPISERQAEQVLCYSHDVIDSIKVYYKDINMGKEYNVPTITSFSDSLGNKLFSNQFRGNSGIRTIDNKVLKNPILYPGDRITLNVEIDESFEPTSYSVSWKYRTGLPKSGSFSQEGKSISFLLEEFHIMELFQIQCLVTSKKVWHKMGNFDEMLQIRYKVLPLRI